MTQEHKELLLKDLCARLPYGVKVQSTFYICDCTIWKYENEILTAGLLGYPITRYKPYLFPLSSMTAEEWEDYQKIKMIDWVHGDINGTFINAGSIVDWLNAHHFDYRGLIEKGLAIDATGLNIY